jgi:hypothetical protein
MWPLKRGSIHINLLRQGNNGDFEYMWPHMQVWLLYPLICMLLYLHITFLLYKQTCLISKGLFPTEINFLFTIRLVDTLLMLSNTILKCFTTYGKHLHDRIISPREDVWAHEASFMPPYLIEVLVPSNEITRSWICVLEVSMLPLPRFIYWKCSDSMVFLLLLFVYVITDLCLFHVNNNNIVIKPRCGFYNLY